MKILELKNDINSNEAEKEEQEHREEELKM